MSLKQIKDMQAERGFTIVELLIVIVVIGILAAIVIVAFNGVQNSAKTQSAKAAASTFQKKYESFNAATGNYPSTAASAAALTTALNAQTESNLGSVVVGTPSSTNGNTTVSVAYCSAGATGVRIGWWDYAANQLVTDTSRLVILQSGTSCTTWATPL